MKEQLKAYWKEIVSVLFLVLIVCIEFAYRQPLYDYSLDKISDWQSEDNDALTDFFKLVSFFGTDVAMAGVLVISYALMPRRMVVKLILSFYVIQNVLAFFKIFYHSPRPYFSSDDVAALNCTHGYGNPSGHCMFNVAFYGTIWALVFGNNTDVEKPFFKKRWKTITLRWITFVLFLGFMVLMFCSRAYLGAHGLNQTLYGSLIGLWSVYTIGFVLPKYINSHYDEFMKKGGVWTKPNCGFFVVLITFVFFQALGIILYAALRNNNSFMNDSWIKRIKLKCPKSWDEITPFEDSFKLSTHTCLYFFFYLAQLFNARYFPKAVNYWYSNIGAKKLLLRTLMVIIILVACIITNVFIDKPFGLLIGVGVLLCNCLAGFVGVPLIDWLTVKWGLINCYTGETSEEPSIDPKKDTGAVMKVTYKA